MKIVRVWLIVTTVLAVFILAYALMQPFLMVGGERRLYAMLKHVDAGGYIDFDLVSGFIGSCKKSWDVVVVTAALLLTANVAMEWLMRQRLTNPDKKDDTSAK